MKMVINAASARIGGAVTYLSGLLHCLPGEESGHRFVAILPEETAARFQNLPTNVRTVLTSAGRKNWLSRLWWEQVTLRRLLKRHRADVLFSTGNFGMLACPARQILLVSNAAYFSEIYQSLFVSKWRATRRLDFILRRWMVRLSVRTTDVVMAPTQATLNDLCRYMHFPAQKALVNWHGATPGGTKPGAGNGYAGGNKPEAGRAVSLLYISLYAEHKNLATLLKALPLLNRSGTQKFYLRTTVDPRWEGAAWTLSHEEDQALLQDQDIGAWVEFVGPVDAEQAQNLYRAADVFVFPSLVESFGRPMVEAMDCGLPIVAADTPVNREVLGPAALYFTPFSANELALRVQRVIEDDDLRKRLGDIGRRRVATYFSWQAHVHRLLEAADDPSSKSAIGVAQDYISVSQGER